jgi:hypothetical protein
MSAASDSLLLKFRPTDSVVRVTRKTVKAMATQLGVPETQVVHLALAKLAVETLAGYKPDDGPLTARQLAAIRADAAKHMPKGKVVSAQSLFS